METRYTTSSIRKTQEMTLAPPDFPFPLEAIATLILKQFLPIEVP